MKTYAAIVTLCDESDLGAELFAIYQQKLNDYISTEVYPALQHKSGESAEFLAEYVKQWNQYTLYTFSVIKMFNYLDRYYLKNCQNDS